MDVVTYSLLKNKITSALTGIASIKADEHGKLIFETNDGEIFSVDVPGGTITDNFVVSNGIGKAEKGIEYKAGTTLAEIVVDMLSVYASPNIVVTTNLEKEILDKVEDEISTFKTTVKVTPGSKDVEKITVYIDKDIIATFEGEDLREDGKYVIDCKINPPTNETFTIKATVYDGQQNTTETKSIVFVGKSYWGYVDKTISKPNDEDIKNLEFNTVKNSRSLTYSEIKVSFGRIVYAYPKTLGALSKIVDEDGRNYTNSYTVYELKVDDIDYYCYLLTDPMGTDNGYQKYT